MWVKIIQNDVGQLSKKTVVNTKLKQAKIVCLMFVSGVMINELEVLATQATFDVVVENISLTTTADLSCDVATWFVNCSATDTVNVNDYKNFSTIETDSFNWTIEGFEEYTTYNCTFQPENDSVNVITVVITTLETGRCNCPIV